MFYLYFAAVITVIIFVFSKKFCCAIYTFLSKLKKKNDSLKKSSSAGKGAQYEHIPFTLDYTRQSAILDDSGSTRTSIYGGLQVIDGKVVKHVKVYDANATTLLEVIEKGAQRSKGGPCLGDINSTRTGMNWLTFEKVLQRTKLLADGLLQLGLQAGPSTKVGIFSRNSSGYLLTELACYHHSMVVVPLYASYGKETIAFIVNHCQISTIYVDTVTRLETILDQLKDFPTLKKIILGETFKVPEAKLIALKQKANLALKGVSPLRLLTMAEVEKLGEQNVSPKIHLPGPADLALICYTSGSTGTPKGVLMSHQNVVADFSAGLFHLGDFGFTEIDVIISFLPLGHMFERICEYSVLQMGGAVGYASGDPKALLADLRLIQPTVMPAVPRMLNRIYASIKETVTASGRLKGALFALAVSAKRAQFSRGSFRSDTFWDVLVFSKIHNLLGGRVRLIPTGSAPINDDILEFLRCTLGAQILVGYGTTEVSSACTISLFGDLSTGNVGVPLPSCTIKLVDVPEMNYQVNEGKMGSQIGGEILIKGSIVFSGYFKDEERTKELLDDDGWFHTGDIGRWNANGTLSIVDRMKDIFKLSQGEYVVPGRLENVYLNNPVILQIFLYGDSLKSAVVAVVVPNFELVDPSLSDEEVKSILLSKLIQTARASALKPYEILKDLVISRKAWTVEDGLLTPTMKNKRFALQKVFSAQIEKMYKSLE